MQHPSLRLLDAADGTARLALVLGQRDEILLVSRHGVEGMLDGVHQQLGRDATESGHLFCRELTAGCVHLDGKDDAVAGD